MARRMGDEMSEPLPRDRVAVANVRLHGVGKGHKLGHQDVSNRTDGGYLRGGMARVKWRWLDRAGRRCQGTSHPDLIRSGCHLPMSDSKHEAATRLPPSLHFERRGAVGILRLSRPHKRNALDDGTIQGIENFFAAIPDDIKAMVIHGEGEHFCAGLDLSAMSERDIAAGIAHSRAW